MFHVTIRDTILRILLGAYFPSNSLCLYDGKYTLPWLAVVVGAQAGLATVSGQGWYPGYEG